jgi:hypothetical protein
MPQNLPPSGLLTSWKEIAHFLGKGVRTVQRWEATLGLPVIRPGNGRSGIVMARAGDLETWIFNGRQHARHDAGRSRQEDDATRATFAECMRALRSYSAEVRTLCDEVQATLLREVDRLRILYAEWEAIRANVLGERTPPATPKIN